MMGEIITKEGQRSFKVMRIAETDSDIAVAIILSIKLEGKLAEAITLNMERCSVSEYIKRYGDFNLFKNETYNKLTDPEHPLVNFSQKIKLANKMGIIGSNTTKAFDNIRKIRNKFAHNIFDENEEILSFKNKDISKKCDEVIKSLPSYFLSKGEDIEMKTFREKFIFAIYRFSNALHTEMAYFEISPVQKPKYLD